MDKRHIRVDPPNAGAIPRLKLDFLNGAIDPRITFTRASSATRFGSDGLLATVGNDVARFDFDPSSPAGVTGPELVSNGAFDSASGWTLGAGWSIGSGSLNGASLTTNADFPSAALTDGRYYQVTYTILSNTGSVSVNLGGGTGTIRSAPGTYSEVILASATSGIGVRVQPRLGSLPTCSIDNISVREVTFTPRGLLIEEQRTNLLLHSRDMTNAAWSKTDVTPTRNQVGLDGAANTACLMTEGVANTAAAGQVGAAVTAGATITASVVLKRGNTDWVYLRAADNTGGNGGTGWFNLATGAKGTIQNLGTGTSSTSTITNLGGGWYRLQVSTIPSGAYTLPFCMFGSATADASGTRVNNATYILDCAQLEVGSFATSIIPTTTATVTRAADSASMTGANFSQWWNASAGTFAVEWVKPSSTAYSGVIAVTDATNGQNAAHVYMNSGSSASVNIFIANAVQYDTAVSGSVVVGGVNKLAYAFASGVTHSASLNGAASTATTSSALPVVDRLWIGADRFLGANRANGHIRSIRYWPRRLSNAQLQALTR